MEIISVEEWGGYIRHSSLASPNDMRLRDIALAAEL